MDSSTFVRYVRLMKTQVVQGIALASLVTVMSSPVYAQSAAPSTNAAEEGVGETAGYGVGAAVATVLYVPVKVTYAGLGVLMGGLGYLFSGGRADVANNIIYPAVRGDYVVTPSNLKGTEPIYFVGAPPPEMSPRADAAVTNPTP